MKKFSEIIRLNSWKKFSPATRRSVRILAILLLMACGPMPIDFGEFYSLFYPENAKTPENTEAYRFTPLYLNGDIYGYTENVAFDDSVNIDSWKAYLRDKVSFEDIRKGLYEKQGTEWLASRVKSLGHTEAAAYLVFCGQADKNSPVKVNFWEESPPADTLALQKLYVLAKENYQTAKDPFIRERYAFQAVKLADMTGKYAEALKDFDALVLPLEQKTFISGWAAARKAGALMRRGKTAESVYHFARVFETVPSRRYQADLSVRRLEKPYFEEALKFCRNNDEKASVYALWAVQPFQDGLNLMKKIYDINPAHPMLELIAAREINKNEYNFFVSHNASSYNIFGEFLDENYNLDKTKVKAAEQKATTYLKDLNDFIRKVISEKKTPSDHFWLAAAAYLSYLDKDPEAATGYIRTLKNGKVNNPYLLRQMAFLEIELAGSIRSAENETFIVNKLQELKSAGNFRDNLILVNAAGKLAAYYTGSAPAEKKKSGWFSSCSEKSEGNTLPPSYIKAFLAACVAALPPREYGYQFSEHQEKYIDTCSATFLRKVLAFKPENETEEKLVKLAGLSAVDLNLALARRLTADEDYAAAAAVMATVPAAKLEEAGFNDYFRENPKEILSQPASGKNPITFLQKMAEAKALTLSDPENSEAWYTLGVGTYNLSYHGSAWLLIRREKSSYEMEYTGDKKDSYYTTENARLYFEKALKAGPEPEAGARICYAGALCERNQYLMKYYSGRPDTYEKEDLDAYFDQMTRKELPAFRTFFEKLKTTYRNTRYQQMLIRECETYAGYLK